MLLDMKIAAALNYHKIVFVVDTVIIEAAGWEPLVFRRRFAAFPQAVFVLTPCRRYGMDSARFRSGAQPGPASLTRSVQKEIR